MKCPEFGHIVSTFATTCPSCGYPLKQNYETLVHVIFYRQRKFYLSKVSCFINIDGLQIGSLENGETLETTFPQGVHTIEIYNKAGSNWINNIDVRKEVDFEKAKRIRIVIVPKTKEKGYAFAVESLLIDDNI